MGIKAKILGRKHTAARGVQPLYASPNSSDNDTKILYEPPSAMVALLTGSTGNLGAYLLHMMLEADSGFSKVYCLNRSANAREKQQEAQESRGLTTNLGDGRVQFIQADFGAYELGLTEDIYMKLLGDVSLIIHNAWPVDFNRSFKSFTPSIDGVRSLIAFSRTPLPPQLPGFSQSSQEARTSPIPLLFVSSISAASNWAGSAPSSRARIPEAELVDWKLAKTGYGQSKLLAERLIAHAAQTAALPASIVRVGQLAGPVSGPSVTKGQWPAQEWLPSLVRSSAALRALPQDLGPADGVDWVPVEYAAAVILDLSHELFARDQSTTTTSKRHDMSSMANHGPRFFNLVNPHQTAWSTLLPAVIKHLPADTQCVSFTAWVDKLKGSPTCDTVPATKLLAWFEYLQDRAVRFPRAKPPSYDTTNAVKASPTLATIPAVTLDWMELWCRQWGGLSGAERVETTA